MAARHHRREEVILSRHRWSSSADSGSVFGLVDRPLRYAAGDDAALLRILRGTLIGSVIAAVGAVTFAAIW